MKKKHSFMWFHRGLDEKNIQLLINFKKHLLPKGLKDRTIHEYLKEIQGWMMFLQEKEIKTLEATVDEVGLYLNKDISDARKTRIVSILNIFYAHQREKRYVKENIIKKYKEMNI